MTPLYECKVESRIRPSVAFFRADGGFHRSQKCFEGQQKSWGGISTRSQNSEIVVRDSGFSRVKKVDMLKTGRMRPDPLQTRIVPTFKHDSVECLTAQIQTL